MLKCHEACESTFIWQPTNAFQPWHNPSLWIDIVITHAKFEYNWHSPWMCLAKWLQAQQIDTFHMQSPKAFWTLTSTPPSLVNLTIPKLQFKALALNQLSMFLQHGILFDCRLYSSNKFKLNSIWKKLARNQIHEQKKVYNNSPCKTRVTKIHNIKNPISHQIKFKQASISMQIKFLKL